MLYHTNSNYRIRITDDGLLVTSTMSIPTKCGRLSQLSWLLAQFWAHFNILTYLLTYLLSVANKSRMSANFGFEC